MADKNGGPAFPNTTDCQVGRPGMTLRDWFAGQALASFAPERGTVAEKAEAAYLIADAMLAARSTPTTETTR